MREQELIEKQEATTNQTIYLMKVGMFFHAYNAGAFALARATGYRIKRKSRKGGREVLVAGFPAESLNTVVPKLEAVGATVTRHSDTLVEITGLDGTSDETRIDGPMLSEQEAVWKRQIIAFDLSRSTPLEALNFLATLQQELRNSGV